jgi:hypothetical protein
MTRPSDLANPCYIKPRSSDMPEPTLTALAAWAGVAAFASTPLSDWQSGPRYGTDLRSMMPLFLLILGTLTISVTAAVMFPYVFGEASGRF